MLAMSMMLVVNANLLTNEFFGEVSFFGLAMIQGEELRGSEVELS